MTSHKPIQRLLLLFWGAAILLLAAACGRQPAPQSPPPRANVLTSPYSEPELPVIPMQATAADLTSSPLGTPVATLPLVTPQPPASPFALPDGEVTAIIAAALGQPDQQHWVTHITVGSFTAPGADERIALVGNIGPNQEIRWVLIGREGDDAQALSSWRLLGVSEWLGAGFAAPPSFYLPPDVIDFDVDGRQELVSHYRRDQSGWPIATDTIYRWDGQSLAQVWQADTLRDNTTAGDADVPYPYRERYQAAWEWHELDQSPPPEIVLDTHTAFLWPDQTLIGEEDWQLIYRWDQTAFRPYAPDGPAGTFAYTTLGNLWLWQDGTPRALGVTHVRQFRWSPDGSRLAWWSQSPPNADIPAPITLGIYDLSAELMWAFSLDAPPRFFEWTSNGYIIYAQEDRPLTLLQPDTGQRQELPTTVVGAWSPNDKTGERIAYIENGNLSVFELATGTSRPLVTAPEWIGAPTIQPPLAWSPQGDWLTYRIVSEQATWLGLVSANISAPVSGLGILETFNEYEAPIVRSAWSPDGTRLAVLATSDPQAQPTTILYVAQVPPSEGQGVGIVEWVPMASFTGTAQSAQMAWNPTGDRLAVAIGGDVWEVSLEGETSLRQHFVAPAFNWNALSWSSNGDGLLVGIEWVYGEHLHWIPSDEGSPQLLLTSPLGEVRWTPHDVRPGGTPTMVFVDYSTPAPTLHFLHEDGSESTVMAKSAEHYTPFHIGGGRVYYNKNYADPNGSSNLFVSDILAGCRSPLASPDGTQLAWLCDDGSPDWGAIISGTEVINFRLVLSNWDGRNPREVWTYQETGPEYRGFDLMSWRADGRALYLSRPKYGVAWAYFDYNPDAVMLDLQTGEMTPLGDGEGIHDAEVSPDGRWLVQSRVTEWPEKGVIVMLKSLSDGTVQTVACTEGALVAGDFSFSPNNNWLAWREWAQPADGSVLIIRALDLYTAASEPITVYEDKERMAPQIGGWLSSDELVLVYPAQGDSAGGHSTVVRLPGVGPGDPLSDYSFIGLLGQQ